MPGTEIYPFWTDTTPYRGEASFGPWRRSRLPSVLDVAGLRLRAPVGSGLARGRKLPFLAGHPPAFIPKGHLSAPGPPPVMTTFGGQASFSPPVGPRRSRATSAGAGRLRFVEHHRHFKIRREIPSSGTRNQKLPFLAGHNLRPTYARHASTHVGGPALRTQFIFYWIWNRNG